MVCKAHLTAKASRAMVLLSRAEHQQDFALRFAPARGQTSRFTKAGEPATSLACRCIPISARPTRPITIRPRLQRLDRAKPNRMIAGAPHTALPLPVRHANAAKHIKEQLIDGLRTNNHVADIKRWLNSQQRKSHRRDRNAGLMAARERIGHPTQPLNGANNILRLGRD